MNSEEFRERVMVWIVLGLVAIIAIGMAAIYFRSGGWG